MIIFGTGSKKLGIKKIQAAKCANCESNDMHVEGYAKYFDIFWIPIFPYSKKLFSVCGNCKQALENKEMSQHLRDKVNMIKSDFAFPWYLFSGLFLIVLGVSFAIYSSNAHEKEIENGMANLSPSDILVFKESYNNYSFIKVTQVNQDTIFFNGSNYAYEGGKPTQYDFNKKRKGAKDFFGEEIYFYLQKDIDSLYKVKDIVDILK